MSPLAIIRQVATCIVFVWLIAPAGAADSPAASGQPAQASQPAAPVQLLPNTPAPIAHSALLTVDAVANADTVQLHIRRVSDRSLVSSDDVAVTVDGRNERVTRQSSGAYELAINNFRGDGARNVEIIVAHDGIREVLSGKVSVAQTGSVTGLLSSDHKQIAWWILNIVVVLIAAIAISRRKG